jgi:hypothetical protein
MTCDDRDGLSLGINKRTSRRVTRGGTDRMQDFVNGKQRGIQLPRGCGRQAEFVMQRVADRKAKG